MKHVHVATIIPYMYITHLQMNALHAYQTIILRTAGNVLGLSISYY